MINPISPGTSAYEVLRKEVGGRGIPGINPIDGMKLRVDLIYLDILNPSEDLYTGLTINNSGDKLAKYQISEATNLYLIIYKLSFKYLNGLLSGDVSGDISERVTATGE